MVYFSIWDAYRLGVGYIRRRFQKTAINVASIALANSFLTSLIFTNQFYTIYNKIQGGNIHVDVYQYWLVVVALIVSIVGITNTMLISVYERYQEIGTMKCLGALDQHIVMIFLVESIIQGTSGGIIGFMLGLTAAIVSAGFTIGFDIIFNLNIMLLVGYLVSTNILCVFLSIIASMYPARRASTLPPVEALSYEL